MQYRYLFNHNLLTVTGYLNQREILYRIFYGETNKILSIFLALAVKLKLRRPMGVLVEQGILPQYKVADFFPGLRIRIHLIWIQHFRLNTDPDPIRIRGFEEQNLEKITAENKNLWIIFAVPDPDPLTRLNPDPIRIRIRNPAFCLGFFSTKLLEYVLVYQYRTTLLLNRIA